MCNERCCLCLWAVCGDFVSETATLVARGGRMSTVMKLSGLGSPSLPLSNRRQLGLALTRRNRLTGDEHIA